LAAQAVAATGGTLRAAVELGLQLVITQGDHEEQRRQRVLDRHLTSAAKSIDKAVLLAGEAWH